MWGVSRNPSQLSGKKQQKQERGGGLAESFRPENFLPGLIIGFIFGLFLDLSTSSKNHAKMKNVFPGKSQQQEFPISNNSDQELKLVLVVRQDLKMGAGKIASQCAHAATGMYAELMHSCTVQYALQQPFAFETMGTIWAGQNSCYMQKSARNVSRNKLREGAESVGLPTFVVADAGRTQVALGSKTVLAVGPGPKALVDSVTGKLRLL